MEKLETLKLENLCEGALPELFQRELAAITENIKDPNANPDAKRELIMKVSFMPFPDRSGAQIELKTTTKLAGTKAVTSNMFIHTSGGKHYALPKDARQQEIFGAAANGRTEKGEVQ